MSTLYVCSVFDAAVSAFMPLFCVRSKGEAIRSFGVACGDPKLPFQTHPQDYRLFLIGAFDDQTGVFDPLRPEPIASAMDYQINGSAARSNVPSSNISQHSPVLDASLD